MNFCLFLRYFDVIRFFSFNIRVSSEQASVTEKGSLMSSFRGFGTLLSFFSKSAGSLELSSSHSNLSSLSSLILVLPSQWSNTTATPTHTSNKEHNLVSQCHCLLQPSHHGSNHRCSAVRVTRPVPQPHTLWLPTTVLVTSIPSSGASKPRLQLSAGATSCDPK